MLTMAKLRKRHMEATVYKDGRHFEEVFVDEYYYVGTHGRERLMRRGAVCWTVRYGPVSPFRSKRVCLWN